MVSIALPAIGRDFHLNLGGLQWVVNAYLVALGSLIILGGSLGDQFGRRRVFVLGAVGFSTASVLCALAPNPALLIAARVVQGVAGALMVPGSLAIVEASFDPEDRGQAIGVWAGWAGISTALGPFVGGALIDAGSWRLVFLIVVLVAAPAAAIAQRSVPESRDEGLAGSPDWAGAALVSLGLGAVVYALVEAGGRGLSDPRVAVAAGSGIALLIAFVAVERRVSRPLIPFELFRSRQFTGANLATLANYFALGGAFFFLILQLQTVLGYGALEAGAATFPFTVVMLLLSPQAGRLSQRVGPRWPMTIGPFVAAGGFLLLAGVGSGSDYLTQILPGVLVFGLGATIFVAPLTSAVLAAVSEQEAGLASALSNAFARLAQLGASATLPVAVGLGSATVVGSVEFASAYERAMLLTAAVSIIGGAIALVTIRRSADEPAVRHPSPSHSCRPSKRRPPGSVTGPDSVNKGALRRRTPQRAQQRDRNLS